MAGRNISYSDNADDTTLTTESEEELDLLLVRVKEENRENWLKTQP